MPRSGAATSSGSSPRRNAPSRRERCRSNSSRAIPSGGVRAQTPTASAPRRSPSRRQTSTGLRGPWPAGQKTIPWGRSSAAVAKKRSSGISKRLGRRRRWSYSAACARSGGALASSKPSSGRSIEAARTSAPGSWAPASRARMSRATRREAVPVRARTGGAPARPAAARSATTCRTAS